MNCSWSRTIKSEAIPKTNHSKSNAVTVFVLPFIGLDFITQVSITEILFFLKYQRACLNEQSSRKETKSDFSVFYLEALVIKQSGIKRT